MKKLQQFHFYMRIASFGYRPEIDLSEFQGQYWFNQNPSFGVHGEYLYTLPFHFKNIHECFQDFNHIQFKNCDRLKNNSQIWHRVKFLQLPIRSVYNKKFVKELKTKMPNLTSIRFSGYDISPEIPRVDSSWNEDVTLKNVTILEIIQGSIENQKDWIIRSLSNVRHLILSYTEIPSRDSQLMPILNKQIQRLDIDVYCQVEQLAEANENYFSSVENLNFYLNENRKSPQWYAEIVLKMLKNIRNLKIMMIRNANFCHAENELSFAEKNSIKILEYFNMSEMQKIYRVESIGEYTLFSKISF